MNLHAEAVVVEADHGIVHPVPTVIVMVEDTQQWLLCFFCLLVGDVRCYLHRMLEYGGTRSHGAEDVGVIHHVEGDVPCICFLSIVPDFERDVPQQHILPELIQ